MYMKIICINKADCKPIFIYLFIYSEDGFYMIIGFSFVKRGGTIIASHTLDWNLYFIFR